MIGTILGRVGASGRGAWSAGVAGAILLVAGCGEGAGTGRVMGVVTVDGAPLQSGQIRLVPADGQGPTAGGAIADGKYSVEAAPGDKKVEISAPRVTGKRNMYDSPNSPTVDVVEELLPAKYNAQSQLAMTVEPGEQEKNFELQTK